MTIGPKFYFDITRADTFDIYSVWVNGRPPLDGGGGTYIGRVWRPSVYGWTAAPLPHPDHTPDSWTAEVARSTPIFFATRKDACIFLYGHFYGTRRDTALAALAALPPL